MYVELNSSLEKIRMDTAKIRLNQTTLKDFISKCDQVPSFQRIWSHLLKKSLMENFIFVQCNE